MLMNKKIMEDNIKNIDILYLDSCTSTNKLLKNKEYQKDTLLITDEQTNGVGRLERVFVSNKGVGIYMSYLTFRNIPLDKLFKITPLTALVVSSCIEELIKEKTYIKWVNDIYLKNKKICGILVESVVTNEGLERLIIGIGINTNKQVFDEELSLKASSIEDLTGIQISKEELISKIINKLNDVLDDLDNPVYMEQYISKSNLINKDVILNINGNELKAKVLNITNEANLVVLVNNEVFSLTTAEVTKIIF